MTFNNESSTVGFIPEGASLEEVIAQDTKELQTINGSFEEIGKRMYELIAKIEKDCEYRHSQRRGIFLANGYDTEELLNVPGNEMDENSPRGRILKAIREIYNAPKITGEGKIERVQVIFTKGSQGCPFKGCHSKTAGSDYKIRNIQTDKKLCINQITAHLAKAHNLLEKGNEYGISAREFYEHFMPQH